MDWKPLPSQGPCQLNRTDTQRGALRPACRQLRKALQRGRCAALPAPGVCVLPQLPTLMLKLKFQSFGHLMQRTDSLEKTLMLVKIEGRRRR